MVNMGIIGYGYWGPNVVRNFIAAKDARVIAISDADKRALKRAGRLYGHLNLYGDYRDITRSPAVDAVAIATPVFSHYEIAEDALKHGKHVFIEKPFTRTVNEAERLIALAGRKHLTVMVDHVFLFSCVVKKIKEIIAQGVLGRLYYYDATRVNLGLFQHDVNVIWDLAPHDLSVMDYIVKDKPVAVAAHGMDHF
ncbi:MAG: Gfo/Idh/MocA family oxidoreductase, partial [Candidatus Omnitrophica bacterium]|nr:Gfo/Idh/MocA family oxidoreductase [Candidatus Omnitrophota bacterium]